MDIVDDGNAGNRSAYERICEVVAGGVSSNMRAMAIPTPLVVERAVGCRLQDVQGNELIDFNMGYGPHVFGYADPEHAAALGDQFGAGAMTGLPHRLDARAGELITDLMPSVEQVRFANSGTEAVMSVVRLARTATGRSLVLTMEGHYHGWAESVLRRFKAFDRTGEDTSARPYAELLRPEPGAPGMTPGALDHTLQARWNDRASVQAVFDEHGPELAAVMVEPVLANAGVLAPDPGFLGFLRDVCDRHGTLLIFDEVITGFRVAPGGAQELYGVSPDLTVLSKVMGGGYPVAALGGTREAMAPLAGNKALHAGVYAGSHAAARAVVSMLERLRRTPDLHDQLEDRAARLERGLREIFAEAGKDVWVSRVGSVMSVAPLTRPVGRVSTLPDVLGAVDFEFARRWQMRSQAWGVYFHPNPLETWFPSTAHSPDDIDEAVSLMHKGLMETLL